METTGLNAVPHNPLIEIFDQITRLVRTAVTGGHSPGRASDQYVTGGVNWNGYGLEPLIRMVADQSNPAQVEAVADLWRTHGDSIGQAASDLQQSMDRLMWFWQGNAADQSAASVQRNARWLTDLGQTASQMASPMEDASGALRSAQSTMPGAPHNSFWSGFGSAAGGAAAGAAIAGPFGAAFGAVIGGLGSLFGFGSSKAKLKRRAVQTMQRYEQAALRVDAGTPKFGQPTDGINGGGSGSTTGGGGGVGPLPGTGTGINNSGGGNGGGTTDPSGTVSTAPSLADDPVGRWNWLTGSGGGLGAVSGIGDGGLGNGGLGGLAGLGNGALGGGFGRGGFGPFDGEELPGRRSSAGRGGDPTEEERAAAAAEEGEEEGWPFGGAGRQGRKDEDKTHKRRVPYDDDLFTDHTLTAPPVIGLAGPVAEDQNRDARRKRR